MGFVDVLLPYLKTENFLVTLATLAELVDDSEAKHLETDAYIFEYLLECLNNAIHDRHRRLQGSWSVRELTRSNHHLTFHFLILFILMNCKNIVIGQT